MLSVPVGGSTWLEMIYGIPERFGILGEGASNRIEGYVRVQVLEGNGGIQLSPYVPPKE